MQASVSRGELSNENKTKKQSMLTGHGYKSVARISRQTPLSKNDMNYIRRSQV